MLGLTIDSLITDFLARCDRGPKRWRLTRTDVGRWEQAQQPAGTSLFDCIAVRLAARFIEGELAFDDCSAMTRNMELYVLRELPTIPELFWKVFTAFDAGEFRHTQDLTTVDPIEVHTKPALVAVLAKLSEGTLPHS